MLKEYTLKQKVEWWLPGADEREREREKKGVVVQWMYSFSFTKGSGSLVSQHGTYS